jgi:hypothetical protein
MVREAECGNWLDDERRQGGEERQGWERGRTVRET